MNVRLVPSAITLLLMGVLCLPAQGQATQATSFVAAVDVSEKAVQFKTEGRFAGFAMIVAGPEAFLAEQFFAGDKMPRLDIDGAQGRLADGAYQIQLTAHPALTKADRATLQQAREAGDAAALRSQMKALGLLDVDRVFAQRFTVRDGKFIVPDAETASAVDGLGAASRDAAPAAPRASFARQLYGATAARALLTSLTDVPEAIATDPAGWFEASFHNTLADGTPVELRGYLRPLQTEPNTMEVYLRSFDALGTPSPWTAGLVRTSSATRATPAARPFDYLTEDATAEAPRRDIVHLDDVIIDGSVCVGFDCVSGESFGFDTARFKENNLRLHFDDTSSSASFPSTDWRIRINDTSNGGASYFAVENATNGTTPFYVDSGAGTNALVVDGQGDVGIGTSVPVLELQITDGDSPSMRLEQDGSAGFGSQTWDIAGNETNFFIRDVTNGSTLPFKIRPGAPTGAIVTEANQIVFYQAQDPDVAVLTKGTAGAGQLQMNDGALATPSFTFIGDTDTGFYSAVDGTVSFAADGVQVARFNNQGMIVRRGSVSAPALAFLVDTNTGIFSPEEDDMVLVTGGAQRLRIHENGDVSIGTDLSGNILRIQQTSATDPIADAWTLYSSRRWKDDIETIADPLALVEQLRGVRYTWKADGKADIGLIAEEVGEVFPEIVAYEENGVDAKSVDYARLVSVLIEAVKAQQAIIDGQKAEMTSMNSRMGQVESALSQLEALVQQGVVPAATPHRTGDDR